MDRTIRTILLEWVQRKMPAAVARDLDLTGYARMKPSKIVVVTGFRRVGKTYMTLLLAQELATKLGREEVVYLNFEDERIPPRSEFLSALLPALRQVSPREVRFLFLDELQNMPDWSRWLRRVYDTRDIRLFVTGSSSRLASREIPTELRGRALEVAVFPLSFREFLRFRALEFDFAHVADLPEERARLQQALGEYVQFGALPEIVLADESRRLEIAQSYYHTVLRRDIIERHRIKNEEVLKALLRLLLNSTGYSISRLHNTLRSLNYEVGKTTVQKYIGYIEGSYFLHSLPVFAHKVKDQLQYPRKTCFIDNVFITAISTRFSLNLGRLYENVVAVELLRRQAGNPRGELNYWRNPQQEEVDFVVRDDTEVKELVQVCYDAGDPDTRKREIRALVKAGRELRCDRLTVVTDDEETVITVRDQTIRFRPLWKWLLDY